MRDVKNIFSLILAVIISTNIISAPDTTLNRKIPNQRLLAGCEPGQTSTELAVNNVRFVVNTGGDIWWDLTNPIYEIPAGSGIHSLFAGSLWIGGFDSFGQIHIAAMRYINEGSDYYPGPLIAEPYNAANTSQEVCQEYDQHFYINREMVREFISYNQCLEDPDCDVNSEFPAYIIPDIILNWPAHGPSGGYSHYLAPFWDMDGDGYYNPYNGDFPFYEFVDLGYTDDPDCVRPRARMSKLYGGHTLWWVFNDNGNTHDETGAQSIGLEIQAQAFAFEEDESDINNMSFYNYQIINRSMTEYTQVYFGVWTDPDLGNPEDDYIGCDVSRGLGYAYNADEYDETTIEHTGYGSQPPAIGIDFFEGPYKDSDGWDNHTNWDTIGGIPVLDCELADVMNGNINGLNFQDGYIDNERLGMSVFMYYNNIGDGTIYTQDPSEVYQYYNYLRGYWRDNSPLYYGCTGHQSCYTTDTLTQTRFAFPGSPTTDPCGWGQNGIPQDDWTEEMLDFPSGDRRFIQSSGPFTLSPGAVNEVTVGAVWARATNGGSWASVEALQHSDDIAQNLFNKCFRVVNGPDAPELSIIESENQLIFHIYNTSSSNNYLDQYTEEDPSQIISNTSNNSIYGFNPYYNFQGYQVFQLKNAGVNFETERYDTNKVKQVFQCDIEDDIDKIINYKWSEEHNDLIPTIEVVGNNKGITHSFSLTKDAFSEDNSELVNFKEYYFVAIAYAYNDEDLFNSQNPDSHYYQKTPYIYSHHNIETHIATPHNNAPENGCTAINTSFGTKIPVEMTEGHGNSNFIIDLEDETIEEILSGYPWKTDNRKYKAGFSPIEVKIIDPLNIKNESYSLHYIDVTTNSTGELVTDESSLSSSNFIPFRYLIISYNEDTLYSDLNVQYEDMSEQLFTEWGFSITCAQNNFTGNKDRNFYQNGFLDAEIVFKDPECIWLNFVKDDDSFSSFNWIRSGVYVHTGTEWVCTNTNFDDIGDYDRNEYMENILDGTWAPYKLVSSYIDGPALHNSRNSQLITRYYPVSSVNLTITSDTTKWSRCCVVETCDNKWNQDPDCTNELLFEEYPINNENSIGGAHKFALRQSSSVDKDGKPDSSGTHGMGWFPGYAIDIRTGRRLNIVFGEDSSKP